MAGYQPALPLIRVGGCLEVELAGGGALGLSGWLGPIEVCVGGLIGSRADQGLGLQEVGCQPYAGSLAAVGVIATGCFGHYGVPVAGFLKI